MALMKITAALLFMTCCNCVILSALVMRAGSAATAAASPNSVGNSNISCAVMNQSNCVSGVAGLDHHGSTATVKFLGVYQTAGACRDACDKNSTNTDPCHSWAFYYPDTKQTDYAGACYGRHDKVFNPVTHISRSKNHVCTAVSCMYPIPPTPAPAPAPPTPPLPPRPASPVDPNLLPIAYLGGVGDVGNENFTTACNFQVVAIINAFCWQASSPAHVNCTNQTSEAHYIINTSARLQKQCPTVLTQMYLNSMMNFWWYTSLFEQFEGDNQSQLLHDIDGNIVRVTQDGGNPNMTVFDFGQNETKAKYMSVVDEALAGGITSFFLDKAAVAVADGKICNHICAQIAPDVGTAWNVGHNEVLREIAEKSSGPTVGNGGNTCPVMGGCGADGGRFATDKSGIEAFQQKLAEPDVFSLFALFPVSRDGYAAFLMGYTHGRSWLWWYSSEPRWIEEFGHKLGLPIGAATLVDGVYHRSFTLGAHVTFDTHTNTGNFQWPSSE
eukprot:m.19750 g.19750  ORF g.19750 m.19750 type:complete len:498 (-) comp12595_c0_seq1:164-1657(-)